MPNKRRKIESAEKQPSRAESVPGAGVEKPAKKERRDPYEQMSYEEAFEAFTEADDERRRAEADVHKLRAEVLNGNGKVPVSARKKLERAIEHLERVEGDAERLRLVASRKFEKEELPGAMEKMSDDEAFDAFLEAEDEYREAEKHHRELKKEVFKKLKGSPSKEQRAKLQEAEESMLRAKERMESMQTVARIKNEEAHLEAAGGLREGEIDIDVSEFESTPKLVSLDQQIAEIEVEIDDLRESGKNKAELKKKVEALSDLKEERSTLETEMRAGEGVRVAKDFETALEEAKKDELLAQTAEEYEKLDKERGKLEKQIKKLTGHDAEQIQINPSLAGSTMQRFGDRMRGFFSKLAGIEAEPHASDLMREWRAVNKRLEELSQTIQPSIGYEAETKATAARTMTDEGAETERALGREATRELAASNVEQAKARLEEYLTEGQFLMEDMKSELREIELYDDTSQFIEHMDRHMDAVEALQDRLSLLQSNESKNKEYRDLVKELEDYYETYEGRLQAKVKEAESFEKEAKTAGKGTRVMSRVSGRAYGPTEAQSTFGTEAVRAKGRRVEMLETQGPKTELGGSDEYLKDIQAYRQEKADEIRVVMQEYEPAAELWEQMNEVLEEQLDPDEYDELTSILGTRDLATAYVLDAAFASMDNDKAAKERVAKVNRLLLLPDDANIETAKKQKKKSRTVGRRKRKTKKKNNKAA